MVNNNDLTKGVGEAFRKGYNGSPYPGLVALILIVVYLIQKYTKIPIFNWLMNLFEWIGDLMWKLLVLILDLLKKFVDLL